MALFPQTLLSRVEGLYARLQAGQLAPDDLVAPDEVEFPNYAEIIADLCKDRAAFHERFKDFTPTFDIFRVFRDPSTIVLDVGAHLGYSAIAMRQHGCKSKIVSIDAIASNVLCLARLKQLDGDAFDFIHQAIADAPGVLRLFVPVMNGVGITALASTGAVLLRGFACHLADQAQSYPRKAEADDDAPQLTIVETPADTLDNLFSARGETARIVGVKMDLEGAEGSALQGAERILREAKPLLMVEGANRDPLVSAVMTRCGYFHCDRRDSVLRVTHGQSQAQDGFWIHPERLGEYRALDLFAGEAPASA